MSMEFMGQDYDRPLSTDERDWLLSWNQTDLVAANEDKHGEAEGGSEEPLDNYDDTTAWKVRDLRQEATNRQIDGASNMDRPTVIQALREWDLANPDTGTE